MNLTIKPITTTLPERDRIFFLYHNAFPRQERFPDFLIHRWLKRRRIEGLAYYKGDTFLGFSFSVVQGDMVFLQYLAILPEAQGQGAGTSALVALKERYPGCRIFLDVEKLDDSAENAEQRRQRMNFYLRNGFFETGIPFKMRGVEYSVLSTDPEFSQEDLDSFWKSISP